MLWYTPFWSSVVHQYKHMAISEDSEGLIFDDDDEGKTLASDGKATLLVLGMIGSQTNFLEVQILFYHTTAARHPLEPPPCEEVICGKFLFSYYFSFHSAYFYFSSSRYGRSILISDELLLGNVSFAVVLDIRMHILCLANQVVCMGG
ncbi:unnamed protein product [Cuscuta europaea]|uniref:Uncharacterized protein n=1 Tax=Cuscuta europaea TaxID=41803 RepID=A0A9P0ZTU9_CUSEU|nr:unnamed protein product [Cuscuta europaea]